MHSQVGVAVCWQAHRAQNRTLRYPTLLHATLRYTPPPPRGSRKTENANREGRADGSKGTAVTDTPLQKTVAVCMVALTQSVTVSLA
jgi:hypothetical protein